jgi:hypothetical protein
VLQIFKSWIPDQTTTKKSGKEKNMLFSLFCVAIKLTTFKFSKFFEQVKKKNVSQLTANLSVLNPKIVTKLSEIWVGSGIRNTER